MIGDTERILTALNESGVRYLVVGGVAVVLHGHLRATNDLDLVIQLRRENILKAVQVFQSLGLQPLVPVNMLEFADEQRREQWKREKNMLVFSLWNPQDPVHKIDLFVYEPFDFETAFHRASVKSVGNTRLPIVSLEDLIAMKRDAGRPQDVADLEQLEMLRRLEEENHE